MENNNKFVTTAIEIVSADALELRMINRVEKVEENLNKKTDTQDKKIEKHEDAVNQKILILEEALELEQRARANSRERRTAEMNALKKDFSDFKNITAQSFNIVHEQFNIHGNLIYLALSQIDEIAIYSKNCTTINPIFTKRCI